jgi:hypothetical protein
MVLGPDWLTTNFFSTKIMASQNLGLPKLRLPNVGQKTYMCIWLAVKIKVYQFSLLYAV